MTCLIMRRCMGGVLAHEMGYASDPRFVVLGGYEYGQEGISHKTRDYGLIAEASAKGRVRVFRSATIGLGAALGVSRRQGVGEAATQTRIRQSVHRCVGASQEAATPGHPRTAAQSPRAWDRIRTSEHLTLGDAEEGLRHYENPWGAFKKAKKLHRRF